MSRLTELYKQQSVKVGAEADAAKNAAQEKERHEGVIKNTKYLQMQSAYRFYYKDYYQETSPIELSSQKQALFCEATNTAENMLSPNCSSAGNAERHTADAHGRQTVKSGSYGDASAVSTSERNTATNLRQWTKSHSKTPLCRQS